MSEGQKPHHDSYYMGIARAVRERADCKGQKVGAVIVVSNRIVSTGYNGVPSGMKNCMDGGCDRCEKRGTKYPSGTAYDVCICVHAEQNALLSAARFGISVEGGTVYTTTQPCFGCLKEMLQAGIEQVYFTLKWPLPQDADQREQYKGLEKRFKHGVQHLDVDDPKKDWATAPAAASAATDQHGMQTP